jgi:hypothetical protein
MPDNIPSSIIGIVADKLSTFYTHAELDVQFMYAEAPGEPPVASKVAKIREWLIRCNKDAATAPFTVLGKLIEDYMEREVPSSNDRYISYEPTTYQIEWINDRRSVESALERHGFSYFKGGTIRKIGNTGATQTLNELLSNHDHTAIDDEFKRTIENIEADPPAALTGACTIVESLCKVYIAAHDDLEMPKKETISALWNVVKKHLGLDPRVIEDEDLKKIITGTGSIVEGLGALRTHAGSAHGRNNGTRYKLKPRHVRLAVHAAHTLVTFVLETWEEHILKE